MGHLVQLVPVALRIEEIEETSAQDEDLRFVRACLQSGDWSKAPKDFTVVRNELTYLGQVVLQELELCSQKYFGREFLI